ncbi:zinc ABC transporter ATP-binding protein AztA [Miltoncostaea marina]|uniref:zinc ABC transporter ATP-binding protein AztA n=1 Tax=Miltoncostaea marina TaxID=2843215 RepID=UPI001C3C5CE0|nr:zinc ABC transporter ATP-binding protein AztA [Miltoncostaea marina]
MTPAPDIPALELRHLTVSYGARPVLWDVDAEFPQGAMSAIVGPNGSGKSTLLRAAMGLVPADAGRVTILGHPAREAMRRVAYVPQREAVDWDFPITVREVVEMGRYPSAGWIRRLARGDRAIVDEALERVGMAPFARRQIGQLSGGQRQRVFVARALAQRAELLVLDEPFAGIDARTEAALLRLLRELRDREGRSIVMVHHDLQTVRQVVDWVLLLNVRAVASGPAATTMTPDNLRRAYGAADLGDDQRAEALWAG